MTAMYEFMKSFHPREREQLYMQLFFLELVAVCEIALGEFFPPVPLAAAGFTLCLCQEMAFCGLDAC